MHTTHRTFVGIVLALTAAAPAVLAQATAAAPAGNPAIVPVPRTDSRPSARHETINARIRELRGQVDLIFVGDSITQGWESNGKEVWAKHYGHRRAANLGVGGDRTQHVLWRLENGNLEGIQPKVAVVMIGTNNVPGRPDLPADSVGHIAEGVRAVVAKLQEKVPGIKILLLGIFPRGKDPNPARGNVLQVNQILQKLHDGKKVWYLDFGYKFVDEDGTIPKAIMPDYLHLSREGYQIWADSIEDTLKELLGEK